MTTDNTNSTATSGDEPRKTTRTSRSRSTTAGAKSGATAGAKSQASTRANTGANTGSGRGTHGTGDTHTKASADPTVEAAASELLKAMQDAAHTALGFGVMAWNKAQVQRRSWVKDLNGQRTTVETSLDGAREQVATVIRSLDARIEPYRHDFEIQIDKASERLPDPVREIVVAARKFAKDTEHQVRQAVGAL